MSRPRRAEIRLQVDPVLLLAVELHPAGWRREWHYVKRRWIGQRPNSPKMVAEHVDRLVHAR